MEDGTIHVAAIVGSLRTRSYNRGLLRAAQELKPEAIRLTELPIGNLPLFNEDLEDNPPAPVLALRQGIREADALLFITPEYNYSIPGVLKNALDWASRPSDNHVLTGKPAAVMGASGGRSATMRAQLHLRQIFTTLDVRALNKPEIYIAYAENHFDDDVNLVTPEFRDLVKILMANLAEWTCRLRVRPPGD